MDTNLKAFLQMIRVSELGQELIDLSDSGYNVLVGSTPRHPLFFGSYDTHPDVYNHRFNSTAAGAYQIIFPTWSHLCVRMGVTDFGPATQDAMATSLITVDCHAGTIIAAGNFTQAVSLCAAEWASLPGSTSGQPYNAMSWLAGIYTAAGGTLVA